MVWLEFEGNPVQWEEQFAVGYCWLAGNQGKKSSAVQQIWSKLSACAMHPWIQWPILTMLRLLLNPLSSCIYFSPRISLHLLMQTYIYPKWWKMHQLFMIRCEGKKCGGQNLMGQRISGVNIFGGLTCERSACAMGKRGPPLAYLIFWMFLFSGF